jgi:hypothetical protein
MDYNFDMSGRKCSLVGSKCPGTWPTEGSWGCPHWRAGIDQIGLRWELSRAGKPVILTSGQYFAAKLSDNYSGMDFFKIMVQGFYHVSP